MYDREIRELRDETKNAAKRNSKTIEKFNSTSSGNYYNPIKGSNQNNVDKSITSSNNGHGYGYHQEQYANN